MQIRTDRPQCEETMAYNPYTLENKTILVTGASSGIGKATAVECSRLGAKLVITGRNEARLEETFRQLEGSGHTKIIADLSSDEGIAALVEGCPELNGFVNNAGISRPLPVQFVTREKMNELFPVNLEAPILLFTSLLKKKKLPKGSSVVFTSSINGVTGGGLSESIPRKGADFPGRIAQIENIAQFDIVEMLLVRRVIVVFLVALGYYPSSRPAVIVYFDNAVPVIGYEPAAGADQRAQIIQRFG